MSSVIDWCVPLLILAPVTVVGCYEHVPASDAGRDDAALDAALDSGADAAADAASDAASDAGQDAAQDAGEADAGGCADGYLDCTSDDGCETDGRASRDHCGACGRFCRWSECESGECEVITAVSAGGAACAVRSSGDVFCWGRNIAGLLGDGTDTARVGPALVPSLTDVREVVVGAQMACAIRTSGQLTCWGSGAVGDGSPFATNQPPTDVPALPDVTAVAVALQHQCAVRASGRVSCWGLNLAGSLGVSSSDLGTAVLSPIEVAGVSGAIAIDAGDTTTCALLDTGEVTCWGDNAFGQLGRGTTSGPELGGVPVVGLTDAVEVAAGIWYACARRASGGVVCWGANDRGQLGDGTTSARSTPVAVSGLTDAVQIEATEFGTCALRATGEVRCWGRPFPGGASLTPLPVPGLADAEEIALGGGFVCARRTAGDLVCLGANGQGQLGDGTTTDSTTPVPVLPL